MIAMRRGYRPNIGHCHACGLPTHLDLLDAKPGTPERVDPHAADWGRLECWECYGPGHAGVQMGQTSPDSPAMRATLKVRAGT